MSKGEGAGPTRAHPADQYVNERLNALEKRAEATGVSLRETAKWITGGVALAAAGVITGTSLSSLGALGLGWRLIAAIVVVTIGILGLAYLFNAALEVIVPLDYSLQQIASMKNNKIEESVKPLLEREHQNLKDFCNYLRHPENIDGKSLSEEELISLHEKRRFVEAEAYSQLRLLLFSRLKIKTFIATPIIVAAFVAFSWAANPAKLHQVPVLEKGVEVNARDVAMLRHALGAACVDMQLRVIVLGEWLSGAQDVVTVPSPSCPPVRLRLDHGRFSQAG
jgi:hypothetical protein